MVDMGLPFGGRTSAGTLPAPSRMSARAAWSAPLRPRRSCLT